MMHQAVTIVAKYFIALSVLTALYVWLKLDRNHKKNMVIEGVVGAVITVALAVIGSKLYHSPRPFVVGHFTPYFTHGNDNGFPSDHTLLAAFLAFLTFKYNKTAGWVLLLLAVAIGLARIIAGVHHSVDIIGSFVFAGIGVYVARLILDRKKPVEEK